ncbi:MAG: hypothetical protein U5K79_08180 [Cyclobacteriaceae bacterium]|nr:hypothetical protein [Cyclobacteriaceae bacterium]
MNPEVDIPFYITKLDGINNEMVKNAPKFYEIAKICVEFTSRQKFLLLTMYIWIIQLFKEEFARTWI